MMDPELDDLKREFLTEAQDKVRQMETELAADHSAEVLQRVAYIAHQLKGSGGSYGYQRISAEAAEIERAVERGDGLPPEDLRTRIDQHVRNLREEIEIRSRELA